MYEGPLRTNVKSVKTSILVLKVIQGYCFRCQSKPVYDFLLVINCNLGPISHRFRDMAISRLKYLPPVTCWTSSHTTSCWPMSWTPQDVVYFRYKIRSQERLQNVVSRLRSLQTF